MCQYSFSVFTPVYNRGGELERVYNSLLRQTYNNFERIIVNDGSTDNTDAVIKQIIERADIPIKYIMFEQNSGKHVAQNRAVDAARGEFFVPLDSDDYVIPETLEFFRKAWNSIPNSERAEYCGVGVHW